MGKSPAHSLSPLYPNTPGTGQLSQMREFPYFKMQETSKQQFTSEIYRPLPTMKTTAVMNKPDMSPVPLFTPGINERRDHFNYSKSMMSPSLKSLASVASFAKGNSPLLPQQIEKSKQAPNSVKLGARP
jgi:hypothetical protein